MDILEKVTNGYEQIWCKFQKIDSKKIYIANFWAYKELEYPSLVAILDQNLSGLEQYLGVRSTLMQFLLKENSHMLKQTQH